MDLGTHGDAAVPAVVDHRLHYSLGAGAPVTADDL